MQIRKIYQAEHSQESYAQLCKFSVTAGRWTLEEATLIEEKLQVSWTLEQIVERLYQEGWHAGNGGEFDGRNNTALHCESILLEKERNLQD
ncbi:IS30 family transposase [Paenibacillus sp. RC254]|uniref:hypothetical protein n=1 Tax=unclassified Paenibacillus TaxID=185978 RepID=UPI0024BA31C4|nr:MULTISPECIES: hypothetical protein [unclassified Paenibacillus]